MTTPINARSSLRLASNMGIWFEQDIQNLLRAAQVTSLAATTLAGTPEAETFQRGFDDAIKALAIGFGVPFSDFINRNFTDLP